jgi:glycosyltransferase involved in cell wall biosynthesis
MAVTMKVVVVLEAVFLRSPDGRFWCSGVFTASFFSRYLAVFDQVIVAARVNDVAEVPTDHQPVEDPRIRFAPIPWYRGLLGYLRIRRAVVHALRSAVELAEAVILRIPSPLAGRVIPHLLAARRPYAVEVVGDPWEVFAPGVVRHPLRILLRHRLRHEMAEQCTHAAAGAYVTRHTLQSRYPTAKPAPMFGCSDIELNDSDFADNPRPSPPAAGSPKAPLRVVLVGTMSQRYKGHDLLLKAMALCRADGLILHARLVGDGVERRTFMRLSRDLGLDGQVEFVGHLARRADVLRELDQADALILPSRTEGLPRAIIEAMARGLPCLGTRVGGIPELLTDEALVPVDDHVALAQAIMTRLRDPTWMAATSARNLTVARTYHQDLLKKQRQDFYRTVHEATARCLETR